MADRWLVYPEASGVWSYDFVFDRTHDGRPLRMLTMVDEYSRECLAIDIERRLNSRSVLDCLGELFVRRGVPKYIRSDNGPEFAAQAVQDWLSRLGFLERADAGGIPQRSGHSRTRRKS